MLALPLEVLVGRDDGYIRDFDDDNPGMDSNQEYHEPNYDETYCFGST